MAFALLPGWARRLYRLPGLPTTDLAATGALRALRAGPGALPDRWTGPPEVRAARAQIEQLDQERDEPARSQLEPPASRRSTRPSRSAGVAMALTALSQSGLTLRASTSTTVDRYRKVGALAARPARGRSAASPPRPGGSELGRDRGYATPKVDVRGALVDERGADAADAGAVGRPVVAARRLGRSAGHPVPGGRAGDARGNRATAPARSSWSGAGTGTPRGTCPSLPFSIYKLFFLCEATGEVGPPDALETLEIGWFALDELPDALARAGSTPRQLGRIVAHHRDPLAADRIRLTGPPFPPVTPVETAKTHVPRAVEQPESPSRLRGGRGRGAARGGRGAGVVLARALRRGSVRRLRAAAGAGAAAVPAASRCSGGPAVP